MGAAPANFWLACLSKNDKRVLPGRFHFYKPGLASWGAALAAVPPRNKERLALHKRPPGEGRDSYAA